jgi:hypothetical protein
MSGRKPNYLPALVPDAKSPAPANAWAGPQIEGVIEGESFEQEPPIDVIIDARQLKERIIDYLGAVLARCWIDRTLLDRIEENPHRALRHLGILLPDEIDIKVERQNQERPRMVIYEFNQTRTFRRRICYLQLIMMAGK